MVKESRTENGTTLQSSYIYDALGQLTEFTRSDDISESYAYDAVGNMLTKTANGVKTKYTYNAANQLISDGTNKYSYDANGNLLEKASAAGAVRYTYNALNLQESWTDGEYTETYSYNADGFLSSITTSDGSSTSLTWDMLMGEGVIISANENGVETSYTYGIERISAISGKTKTEYVYDGRGSVAAEVSYTKAWYTLGGALSKKDIVSKSYTPFGEQIGEAASGFGYNGEYYNAATGQIYLRARFYEPEMNRFSQKDIVRGSITVPASLNRYTYVQNDPVNFIDPSGESLRSAWNSVKNAAKSVVSTVKTVAKKVTTAVKNTAAKVVNTVKNAAKSVANTVRNVVNNVASRALGGTQGNNTSRTSPGVSQAVSVGSNGERPGVIQQIQNYFNSKLESGKKPSPDSPSVETTTVSLATCNALDVASIFRAQYAQYGSTFAVLGSIALTEPTPAGEIATGLFGLAVTVIAVYETGKVLYKGYKDGTFIDLDEVDLPRIMVNPIPEIHNPVIEKLPLPEDDRDSLTESLPLPDAENSNVTTLPLPDEKKDLIIEASDVGPYNWGNSDTLDYVSKIKQIENRWYTDKSTIDQIGQIESKGIDFDTLTSDIISARASTEGGLSVVIKYSDDDGVKFVIHQVTDVDGKILHRDFDAVRIESGQIINKE